jgi:hypothetical protein
MPQLISLSLTSIPKLLFILSPAMHPFNAQSTTAATRKIPPLKEAPPTKVMSCAMVATTDLEKDLDAAKEVIGGAGVPSPLTSQPQFVAITSMPWFHLYLRLWNVPDSCFFPSSDNQEGAPIGHVYTSHYRDSHSKEGDHPASTCGPFK